MEFVKYEIFSNIEDLKEMTDLLDSEGIDYQLEDHPIIMSSTLSLGENFKEYILKLRTKDFETVKNFQISLIKKQIDTIQSDYHLLDYSVEELQNILKKPDEWSSFDVALAKHLLKERGIVIDEVTTKQYEQERMGELFSLIKTPVLLIMVGYLFALFGGVFGIFIGHHLRNHKRTLPNGEWFFGYTNQARIHGAIILLIGIPILIYSFALFVLKL